MTKTNSSTPLFNKVVVVGVGLIGGSLAKAIRQRGIAREVIGVGRNPASLQRGVELGVIDDYSPELSQVLNGADLVVIAVPVLTTRKVFEQIRSHAESHNAPLPLMTDVGSAKASIVADAVAVFGESPASFVPGHPVAGSERNGVEAANAELFEQHRVILTPVENTTQAAVNTVRELWQLVGAEVVEMDVEHHDGVLAATSHIPHLLAYSLVDTLASGAEQREIFRYAAGGFRDFTRIASSDPAMWRDIMLANKDAVLHNLDSFTRNLEQLQQCLEQQDGDAMLQAFNRAKNARDYFARLYQVPQPSQPADAPVPDLAADAGAVKSDQNQKDG